jgi:hypothetical protein
MLKINFLPESDLRDYSKILIEYEKLWKKEGKKIVETIEKVSKLKFKETEINAMVYFGSLPSRSRPLSLMVKDSTERRLSILIHELTHRVISGNSKQQKGKAITSFEVHKMLDLILYDIWVRLYGKEFAEGAVGWEKEIPGKEYKKAWEWALSFTKEERETKFSKFILSIKA